MKATLLDTVTGKKAVVEGYSSWDFAEGNLSCGCNRARYFDNDSECESRRYIVIEATPDAKDHAERDIQYSLADLNQDYPLELLVKHGIEIKTSYMQMFDPTS